jgi:hypothetical protein
LSERNAACLQDGFDAGLNGSSSFEIMFLPGQEPPVNGFWSFDSRRGSTLVDRRHRRCRRLPRLFALNDLSFIDDSPVPVMPSSADFLTSLANCANN